MKEEIIQMVQDIDNIVTLELVRTLLQHPYDIELFEIIRKLLQYP